jgi:hypothetical protein
VFSAFFDCFLPPPPFFWTQLPFFHRYHPFLPLSTARYSPSRTYFLYSFHCLFKHQTRFSGLSAHIVTH